MKNLKIFYLGLFVLSINISYSQSAWDTLFYDDFTGGSSENWTLEEEWQVVQSGDNYFLKGLNHHWARCNTGGLWSDYGFTSKIRIVSETMHINFHVGDEWRYFLGFSKDGFYLDKQVGDQFFNLADQPLSVTEGVWHSVEIIILGKTILVSLNGELQLQYYDEDVLPKGSIAFETLEGAEFDIDSVLIEGEMVYEPPEGYNWFRTGGPIGGLGYDIRIHPFEKRIMFVTDNPSGINKSTDGGATWIQKNSGISVFSGAANDGIPIFSLTIDPSNPGIVWSGTQNSKGIFKSVDGGETWEQKDNGVTEGNEISFRGFAIHPENSDIVLAAAEIGTIYQGIEFNKTKGKIYKTIDGGETWYPVWNGDNLARVLLFDYLHSDTIYCSTGIFDREAYNSDIASGILGGVGILRSYDGGENWDTVNTGIDNLYLGFLEMHPENPQILYAAASNNATSYPPNNSYGGIYKTEDGCDHWQKLIDSPESYGAVAISRSNPDIVYAIGSGAYRSDNAGGSWTKLDETKKWGPPGIFPGFVISTVVDPENPDIVWVNNYGGGNFLSTDGGITWKNSSKGYTGANLRDISICFSNPYQCYVAGRSGPFVTYSGGNDWPGINYNYSLNESYTIEAFPDDPNMLLAANDGDGAIQKSVDGGMNWTQKYKHPLANEADPNSRYCFRDIAISLANPDIVYGGTGKVINVGLIDPSGEESLGMYKSTDRGENWSEINNGLETTSKTVNTIAVHPANPDIVYIGTYTSGIYRTVNGGSGWVPANNGLPFSDVRSIAIDPLHPDTLYAGSGNGTGMARSFDGGNSWYSINEGVKIICPTYLSSAGKMVQGINLDMPNLLNTNSDKYIVPWTKILDIVIDPVNSQHVFAADFSSGVYYSQNGGESWSLITDGMGIKSVTCLSINDDGTVLYCGTEGGGVYRMVLSNHAPSVYSRIPISDTITIYRGESIDLEIFCSDINNDTLSYAWFIDDIQVETFDSTVFSFQSSSRKPGYYTVLAIVNDGSLISETIWTIHVITEPEVTENIENENYVRVHPNPFSNIVNFSYYLESQADVLITITDIQGREVGTAYRGRQNAGSYTLNWNFETQSSFKNLQGVYICRFIFRFDDFTYLQEKKIVHLQ